MAWKHCLFNGEGCLEGTHLRIGVRIGHLLGVEASGNCLRDKVYIVKNKEELEKWGLWVKILLAVVRGSYGTSSTSVAENII